MSSEATVPGSSTLAPRRARRLARWSPAGAVGLSLLALAAGQVVAAIAVVTGGEKASWVDGLGLVAADLVTLAIILLAARRGADRLGAATFGVRRTDATAALG